MILLTGASGFLGNFFKIRINSEDLITISKSNSDIKCDLSNQIPKIPPVNLVIHAAGKAHSIPKTDEQKQKFIDVNVTGTQNLLKGLNESSSLPNAFIFISSVAVYGLHQGVNINEEHPLNAMDSYGLSKIHAEKLIQEWCNSNNVTCSILRLPLLVGQDPPGNLGSMIKAIQKGYYMNIAGGLARKSMVMAEDVAKIVLKVSEVGGIYNLTDGYHPNFKELSFNLAKQMGKSTPLNIPNWFAKIMAKTGDIIGMKAPFNSNKLTKITADLTFDDSKARKAFGWNPTNVLEAFKL
jgi:nucleoside-diphosphate-sugar epimerase